MEDGWKLKVVNFPGHELYGLTSQLRRAAMSVPMNLVAGARRRSQSELARFINIAQASLAEVQYQLKLAEDLRHLPSDHALALRAEADAISAMLYDLWRSLTRPGNHHRPSTSPTPR
ncbi:MAG: four helix bundle protein, partial [Myxococcaceae bacterium]|nr:four helix bundle protein [Myxococcaceae bacterium]